MGFDIGTDIFLADDVGRYFDDVLKPNSAFIQNCLHICLNACGLCSGARFTNSVRALAKLAGQSQQLGGGIRQQAMDIGAGGFRDPSRRDLCFHGEFP